MDNIHVGAAWSKLGQLAQWTGRDWDLGHREQEALAVSLLGVTERCKEDLGAWTLWGLAVVLLLAVA
jgi:hypothetical protein